MSLIVSLEILGATQEELKALAGKLPTAGKLSFRTQKDSLFFWKWKGFQISGVNEGLSENANPRSEHWALENETTKDLVEILHAFHKICPRRISLFAAFSGDLPKRETEVQMSELLELISGGHLGNKVKYQVRPDQPQSKADNTPEDALESNPPVR